MARIDYTNIYSEPSDNVYNLIDTRTNVSDPRDPQNIKNRKFVYHFEPRAKAMDFSKYPYIIVEDGLLDTPTMKTIDAKKEYLRWSQTVIVRTVSDGSGSNRTDAGHTDMRTICNGIIKTLKNSTNKQTLRDYDMFNVDVTVTNIDTVVLNQQNLHETTFEVTYATKMQVSV